MGETLMWVWEHPFQYMGIGLIVGFVLIFAMLIVGGDPADMFTYGKWSLIGVIAWLIAWPVMFVLFFILTFAVAAAGEP